MMLVKLVRIAKNPFHEDNYVDLAAYAGIAGECAGIAAMAPKITKPLASLKDLASSVSWEPGELIQARGHKPGIFCHTCCAWHTPGGHVCS